MTSAAFRMDLVEYHLNSGSFIKIVRRAVFIFFHRLRTKIPFGDYFEKTVRLSTIWAVSLFFYASIDPLLAGFVPLRQQQTREELILEDDLLVMCDDDAVVVDTHQLVKQGYDLLRV